MIRMSLNGVGGALRRLIAWLSEKTPCAGTVTSGTPENWLLLPTRCGQPNVLFTLEVDGKVIRHGNLEYAPDAPEHFFGVEVPSTAGGPPVLRIGGREVEVPRAGSRPAIGSPEQELARPVVHFTASRGWLNDPNGLIWHEGEWHLFYQHNPYGIQWGNMHWGHAVSRDLIHWKEMPIAIRPVYGPALKDGAFSGSAVFDAKNSLERDAGPALVAMYTSTGRGECLVYSHDGGRTWREYPGNPVLVHGGSNTGTPGVDGFWHDSRDPRVFRFERDGTGHWVMVVYEQNENDKKSPEGVTFAIYVSEDLRNWTRTQVLPGWYECPELIPFSVERSPASGQTGQKKWVLMEASGSYAIGEFDGKCFVADARSGTSDRFQDPNRPYIHSPDKYAGPRGPLYAGQTWSEVPESDGRRVFIGWIKGKTPANAVFSQMMSLPTELTLRETSDGLRLHFAPVAELEKAYGHTWAEDFNGSGSGLMEGLNGLHASAYRVTGRVHFGESPDAGLNVRGLRIQRGMVDGYELAATDPGSIQLDLIVDRGAVEWFVNGGRYYGVHASGTDSGGPLLEADDVRLEGFSVIELARKPQP